MTLGPPKAAQAIYPKNVNFDSQNLDKNFEGNLIGKIKFIKENLDRKMGNNDGDRSDDTMGDVDELRYDTLYAKSMVLRRKMNILLGEDIGDKGRLRKILNCLVEELAGLSQQIMLVSARVVKD
jgi:hypothetical protein